MLALGPYQGGSGHWVWALDQLDIADKHLLLVPVGVANSSVILDVGALALHLLNKLEPHAGLDVPRQPVAQFAIHPSNRPRVEHGVELYAGSPEEYKHYKPEFTFDVAFGDVALLEGEPVVPTLRRLIDEVESLLSRLVPLA